VRSQLLDPNYVISYVLMAKLLQEEVSSGKRERGRFHPPTDTINGERA
jgi:hypothetical protein